MTDFKTNDNYIIFENNKTLSSRGQKLPERITIPEKTQLPYIDWMKAGWNPRSNIQSEKELFLDTGIKAILEDTGDKKFITTNCTRIEQLIPKEEIKNKKQKEEEKSEIRTSTYKTQTGELYEQVMINGLPMFATIKNGEIQYINQIEEKEITIKPCGGEEIYNNAVILPKGIKEYNDQKELTQDIVNFVKKYDDLHNQLNLIIASHYILLTWIYDDLNTINYLHFIGDYGSGKTRSMDVIGRLCYKPIIASGAVTPAPLYRLIDKWKGTLIIDEADFNKETTDDITKIFNLGFQQGQIIARCDQKDANIIRCFNPFCPKIIGSRKRFKDAAFQSRCFSIQKGKTERTDIPVVLPQKTFETEQEELRQKLLMYRLKNKGKISSDHINTIKMPPGIEPRLKQAMGGFYLLFGHDVKLQEEFSKLLIVLNQELVNDRQNSVEGWVANAIIKLWDEGIKNITSKEVADKINQTITLDKPFKTQSVGNLLKSISLTSKVTRFNERLLRIIILNDVKIESLRERYCIKEVEDGEIDWNIGENVTTVTGVMPKRGEGECKKNLLYYKDSVPEIHWGSPKVGVTPATPVTNQHYSPLIPTPTKDTQKSPIIPETQTPESLTLTLEYLGGEQPKDWVLDHFGEKLLTLCLNRGDVFEPVNGIIKIVK